MTLCQRTKVEIFATLTLHALLIGLMKYLVLLDSQSQCLILDQIMLDSLSGLPFIHIVSCMFRSQLSQALFQSMSARHVNQRMVSQALVNKLSASLCSPSPRFTQLVFAFPLRTDG